MKIYKVSPIIKYSPFFSLTYVSKLEFQIGNVVPINFNNREVLAVVIEKYTLKEAKVEIRKSDFKTKKIIHRVEKEKVFSKKEFKALEEHSNSFGIPVGEIVNFIYGADLKIPAKIDKVEELIYFPDDLSLKVKKTEGGVKGSEAFTRILENKIKTITIKDFTFDRYLNFQSPHISKLDLLFIFLENFQERKVKVILETEFLGVVETEFVKNFKGKLVTLEVQEKKSSAKKFFVKTKARDQNGEDEILASEIVEKIKAGGKNFVFVLSHGYADRIFCNDCRHPYECENCGHGYSLLNDEDGKYLFCKNCKNKKILKENQYVICKHCGSWRVFPFGIGGQKVFEFLNNPKSVLIDESEKKLPIKKITDKIKEFLSGDKQTLIGSLRTLKVLQNLNIKVDKGFVVSTGALVRGKDFDSDEKLLKLLSEIEGVSNEVYINRREGDEISLENYKTKSKFVEEELKVRRNAELPPYTKVLSLIFNYRNKRFVDKFLTQDIEKLKQAGEIKKGNNYIYYWFVKDKIIDLALPLRNFGDVVVANTIIEQSILGKK